MNLKLATKRTTSIFFLDICRLQLIWQRRGSQFRFGGCAESNPPEANYDLWFLCINTNWLDFFLVDAVWSVSFTALWCVRQSCVIIWWWRLTTSAGCFSQTVAQKMMPSSGQDLWSMGLVCSILLVLFSSLADMLSVCVAACLWSFTLICMKGHGLPTCHCADHISLLLLHQQHNHGWCNWIPCFPIL